MFSCLTKYRNFDYFSFSVMAAFVSFCSRSYKTEVLTSGRQNLDDNLFRQFSKAKRKPSFIQRKKRVFIQQDKTRNRARNRKPESKSKNGKKKRTKERKEKIRNQKQEKSKTHVKKKKLSLYLGYDERSQRKH